MTGASAEMVIDYFGKIPSRDDFIKASSNPGLIKALDAWLAQGMELLSADPRWRLIYDAMPATHFAFLGLRSRHAVAGHLVASCDQAGRRFPFLTVGAIESAAPIAFARHSPAILSSLWTSLEAHSHAIQEAKDPSDSLHALAQDRLTLNLDGTDARHNFGSICATETVGSLGARLQQAGFEGSVRQLMLGLGLLLQPVLSSLSCKLDRSLALPLPAEPALRYEIAAYWMHLITPFLVRSDVEISLFIMRRDHCPVMLLGFNGASPHTLHAVMAPRAAAEHAIGFDDASWVEDSLQSQYGVRRLSACLSEPGLSLQAAHELFLETFLGT